ARPGWHRDLPGRVRPLHHVPTAALSNAVAHDRRRLLLQLRPHRRGGWDSGLRFVRESRRLSAHVAVCWMPVRARWSDRVAAGRPARRAKDMKTCRDFGYVADDHWAKLPPGYSWPEVAGVATDSRDNVFVFNRGEHPVVVFDRAGNFLRSWGEG